MTTVLVTCPCGHRMKTVATAGVSHAVCPKCGKKAPVPQVREPASAPTKTTRKDLLSTRTPPILPQGSKKRIGELLVETGLLEPEHVEQALAVQQVKGGRIVEILISLDHIDPDEFATFLARRPGTPSLDLTAYDIPSEVVSLVSRDFAIEHEVCPIDRLGDLLTLGMACPLDAATVKELEQATELKVKPVLCSASHIRAAINRYYPEKPSTPPHGNWVSDLASSVRLTNIPHLIRQLKSLPALPKTVERVREAMGDPDQSVNDVAKIIALDPPIAAKVLSVANSAAYGLPRRVETVNLAVALLGLRESYSIVLSAAVINLFDPDRKFDYQAFWRDSICCAAASRLIASTAHHPAPSSTFTAGLLHNIGRMALSEVVEERYAKIGEGLFGAELIESEEQVLGINHLEAGYELATHWGLPTAISESIRFHHAPEHATTAQQTVHVVALGRVMADADPDQALRHDRMFEGCDESLAFLKLDKHAIKALLNNYFAKREGLLETF